MSRIMIIKSNPENLRLVEKFIDEISEELKLSDEVYGNILIATLEATNNAIVHGNKQQEDLDVEIFMEETGEGISMTIKDFGKGFNPNDIPDPTAPGNIEKTSGRGVFLMSKLSDSIEFFENGTKVKLFFNIN
ncbi:MAG: ATP-binding protein [Bacteroidales bacterium]|nr:ATP-binding protein [Bacteroidales bacterium]MCF8389671.1 ATP-binding protein [Bacteroidales bacterium]